LVWINVYKTWRDDELRVKPWIASVLGLLIVGLAVPSVASVAAKSVTTLNLFDDGDTNIEGLWNLLIPQYEKLHPNIKIHLIWLGNGNENTVWSRMVASVSARKPDPIDITDASLIGQGELINFWVKDTTADLPNVKLVNPDDLEVNLGQAVPYRGSEVVLAYNSTTVKNPPTTLNQLISWIEANPGKFTYCNPADGGSGDAFVQAMVERGLSAKDDAEFRGTVYNPKLESLWTKNLQFLAQLGKDTYRSGYYPNSNTGVITLLAQGAIQMATVWSDEGTAALTSGELPKTIKLTQLKTPFYGGPSSLAVPKNSAHVADAMAFVNWVLEPAQQVTIMNFVAGFPGIEWKYLPKSEQAKFKSVEAPYLYGMSGKYDTDMAADWQKVVAGGSKG
jgi:putative spermidine/putrescine transport system substrate-binding protein